MAINFNNFFNPQSVAVIGASSNSNKVGYALLKNIIGNQKRKIFPVNLKEKEILGLPCCESVLRIEEMIDLAIIAVPAEIVPQVLRECGEKKISSVVIVSAGFGEVSGRGVELENEIKEIAVHYNIALLGPNCLGVLDFHSDFNASFMATETFTQTKKGNISFFSQSGALGAAMFDWANKQGIGFSKFVSLGNEVVLTELDFLEFLQQDDSSQAALLYLEKISDGERFIQTMKNITTTKPVVMLKAGRSSRGKIAVKSHTGSLVSDDAVFEAVCEQTGVIVVHSLRDFFGIAKLFHIGILKPLNNVAILTNGGGPSIIATDLIEFSQSLTLAEFSQDLKQKIKNVSPQISAVHNPIDILGDARALQYKNVLDLLVAEKNIDVIFTILTPQMMTEISATAEVFVSSHKSKPIIPIMIGGAVIQDGVNVLQNNDFVNFNFPEDAILALDVLSAKMKKIKKKTEVLTHKQLSNLILLDFEATRQLLQSYNLESIGVLIKNKEDLVSQVKQLEFSDKKMAMKIVASDIIHKTDTGGVEINLEGETALLSAWDKIMVAALKNTSPERIQGVLLQPMVKGQEVIIGMKRDPIFGPVIIFGLGGVFVEVLKDVSMRIPPITDETAKEMIEKIKGFPVLNGLRDNEPVNFSALIKIIIAIARLSAERPEIKEIDLNPVMVNTEEAVIVDARLIIE